MHTTKVKLFAIVITAILSACSTAPKQYAIKGEGTPILNRDSSGRSLSVVVRLYQLKSANEFSKLTFDILADGRPEEELLKSELLAKTDVVIVPGGNYVSTDKLLDEAKYVGVVAFFRNPDQHYWRFLLDADDVRSGDLSFRVEDCYIVLKDIKPLAIPGQPKDARPRCSNMATAPLRQSSQPAKPSQESKVTQPNSTSTAKKRSWLPQNMPDVNVNIAPKGVPVTTQVGSGGPTAVNVGAPSAPAPQGGSYFSGSR
ncbi:MAG: type VI secretion system lipoprotein TssJ [Betaproteobacteria bacterium]